ncbi:MAG: glycosyltransferase family 2 protein, partial [Gammaproteobacteria bacterium]|nr:glycosyltransferase family 2 protein [Gammaproteobacteria bacterium]
MYKNRQVCAVIPARDEAAAIGGVVSALNATGMVDRIVVCD